MSPELRCRLVEPGLQMNASGINRGTAGRLGVRWCDGQRVTPSGEWRFRRDACILRAEPRPRPLGGPARSAWGAT